MTTNPMWVHFLGTSDSESPTWGPERSLQVQG